MSDLKRILAKAKKAGRHGDSDLVHVNESEKNLLERVGSGTTNPTTGLKEYYADSDDGSGWGSWAGGENDSDGDGVSDGAAWESAMADADGTESDAWSSWNDSIGTSADMASAIAAQNAAQVAGLTGRTSEQDEWEEEAKAARAAGQIGIGIGPDPAADIADALSGLGSVTGSKGAGEYYGTEAGNDEIGKDEMVALAGRRGVTPGFMNAFNPTALGKMNELEEMGLPTFGYGLRGADDLNGKDALNRDQYFGPKEDSISGGALDLYQRGEYGRPGDFIENLIGLAKFGMPMGTPLTIGGGLMNRAKSDLYANTDDPRGMTAWDRTFAQAQDAQARQAADDYRASQMGIGESFDALGRFGGRMTGAVGGFMDDAVTGVTDKISDFMGVDSTKTGSLPSILSGKDEDEELTEAELSTIMGEAGVRGRSDPSVELAEGLGKTGLGTIAGTRAGYDFGKDIWGDRNAVTQGLNSFLSYLGSAGGDAYEGLIQAGVADPTTFNINGQDVTVGPDTISSGGVTLDVTDTGVSWSPFRGEGDEEEKKAEGGIVQGQQGGGLETLHDNINRGQVIDYSRTNPQESSVVSLDKPSYNNSIQSHYLSGY